ncbi:MAG: tetratricopeptide repeat protein [Alistipes sp.]|jgi:tetratricopeptide (TPR) repeat protein|nr:tetratricopeptide repeat protein [Alistipes sp.]
MAKRKSTASKAKAVATEQDPEVKIENALGKTEAWFEKNWKPLTFVVVAALVVVAGFYAYEGLYKAPQGRKAADAMFVAQQLFAAEDYTAALEGDGVNPGFAEIADNYGGTHEGRLAAHYAGICYLRGGDLDSALEYLAKYKAVKGVPGGIINAQNEGLRGDIYVQKGEYATAIDHFRRAVEASDNSLSTPTYLKKLGLALEATGDYAAASVAYRRVKDEFPMSLEGRDIEKFASAAEQKIQ